jgi:hypothetical protein
MREHSFVDMVFLFLPFPAKSRQIVVSINEDGEQTTLNTLLKGGGGCDHAAWRRPSQKSSTADMNDNGFS